MDLFFVKRVYKFTTLIVLISFKVKHRRRIFRMENGMKGKDEGMVYVSHHFSWTRCTC